MSDRIVIMDHGRIAQIGGPEELYDRPQSRYVADFVGRSNFISATTRGRENAILLAEAEGLTFRARGGDGIPVGSPITLSLRPEEIRLAGSGSGHRMAVTNRIFLGEHTEYHLTSGAIPHLIAVVPRTAEAGSALLAPGAEVIASWREGAALALEND